jgi:hypothetical protein
VKRAVAASLLPSPLAVSSRGGGGGLRALCMRIQKRDDRAIPQRPVAEPLMLWNYVGFRDTAQMAGPAAGSTPSRMTRTWRRNSLLDDLVGASEDSTARCYFSPGRQPQSLLSSNRVQSS